MRRRPALLLLATLIAIPYAAFEALDRAYPPNLDRLEQTGQEFLARDGRTLAMLPASGGIWRLPTTPAELSPTFRALLLQTEDRRFYQHGGVDPRALLRAAWQWLRAGRVVSGGSTITMQVARLLEPRPRTLRSKLIETFRALQLERRLTKDDILTAWLTLAPFGANLEGVRAGAMAWFGVRPAALDRAQSALLVALPRRPEALRPDRHPAAALALRNRLLAPTSTPGLTPDLALTDPLPTARILFPRHAEPALRPPPRRRPPAPPPSPRPSTSPSRSPSKNSWPTASAPFPPASPSPPSSSTSPPAKSAPSSAATAAPPAPAPSTSPAPGAPPAPP